jgi:hypothetical protein
MKVSLGRHVYGLAAILFGIITVVSRDFNTWQQIQALGNVPPVRFPFTWQLRSRSLEDWRFSGGELRERGAVALGCFYLVFALMWVPRIAAEPMVYDRWGNFLSNSRSSPERLLGLCPVPNATRE